MVLLFLAYIRYDYSILVASTDKMEVIEND